jgi:hypothetical protein
MLAVGVPAWGPPFGTRAGTVRHAECFRSPKVVICSMRRGLEPGHIHSRGLLTPGPLAVEGGKAAMLRVRAGHTYRLVFLPASPLPACTRYAALGWRTCRCVTHLASNHAARVHCRGSILACHSPH